MRKVLFTLLLMFCLVSCVETYKGNYGVITNIELMTGLNGDPPAYKYKVTIKYDGDLCDEFNILTNESYHVGDSVEIRLKEQPVEKDQPKETSNNNQNTDTTIYKKYICYSYDSIYNKIYCFE